MLEDSFRELCHSAVEFLVNVGLIDSISARWPEDVQEQWEEWKTDSLVGLSRRMEEAQHFASSHD